MERKQYDVMVEEFETAKDIDPGNGALWLSLGVAKSLAKQHCEGLKDIEKAFAINPELATQGNKEYLEEVRTQCQQYQEQVRQALASEKRESNGNAGDK